MRYLTLSLVTLCRIMCFKGGVALDSAQAWVSKLYFMSGYFQINFALLIVNYRNYIKNIQYNKLLHYLFEAAGMTLQQSDTRQLSNNSEFTSCNYRTWMLFTSHNFVITVILTWTHLFSLYFTCETLKEKFPFKQPHGIKKGFVSFT